MLLKLSLVVFLLGQLISCSLYDDTSTLKLVQVISRHGDRTPIFFYQTDPYRDMKYWPDGVDELTPQGKDRMYHFGLTLRHRYGNFLTYNPKEIYARSSSTNRDLETVYAVLAGLYPPKGRLIWSNKTGIDQLAHNWQPIAVQTVEEARDELLKDPACVAAEKAKAEMYNSSRVRKE